MDQHDIMPVTVKAVTMHVRDVGALSEAVFESGCRDLAPPVSVLKNVSYDVRKRRRLHHNEIQSLERMLKLPTNDTSVLKNMLLRPKGVMLWSLRGIQIYQERCKEDIVYLDAMANHTQGIMEKSQWDLKHLRFQSRTYSRLDDVVLQYQALYKSLLREYRDTARVFNMKQKAQPSSPGSTSTKKSQKSQLPSIYVHSPACSVRQLAHDPIHISPGPRIIKKPICVG
uniref:Uncharacterized protein n=1 Tax=Knipowitschia caucasica TaxID=637954 RepID=A0AAV2JI36_KNICA